MSLKKILECWSHPPYATLAEMRSADAITLPPFGTHRDGESIGVSNYYLGEACRKLHQQLPNIPLLLQWEHEDMEEPKLPIQKRIGLRGSHHINTREYFKAVAVTPHVKRIILIAHQDHVWRSKWIAEKLGFEVLLADPGDIPYDPISEQWWTRSRRIFLCWEFLTRIHHILRGWI